MTKENNIVENTELKKVLINNLESLNKATSQATINEMFEAMKNSGLTYNQKIHWLNFLLFY